MSALFKPALLLAAVLLFACPLAAQVSEGWSEEVVLGVEDLGHPTGLVKDWRFHPGDDSAWADPDYDDSHWTMVLPSLENIDPESDLWTGIGWFRRHIRITEAFAESVGIYMAQAGASEVYLDGELVARFGTVSADPIVEVAQMPQYVTSLTLKPDTRHLLAVRYSNAHGNVFRSKFRGFEMIVGEMEVLTAVGIRMIRQMTAVLFASIGLFTAFAILFLLLFAFQPSATENLFFAIFNGSLAGLLITESQANAASDISQMLVYFKWTLTGLVVMALSALLVEYKVFKMRIGPTFYGFALAAVAVCVWIWTRPAFGGYLPLIVFTVAIYLMTLWLAILALIEGKPDAWIVGLGFFVLTLSVFATLARASGWLQVSPIVTTIAGLGVMAICLSVYLTRRVARTNRELELRLGEVESLTAQTIEQERRAALEEAKHQVLEADNARKTAELEEARQLQLAMLPKEVPRLANFDVAVHMTTANEVGGDYYDFASNGNGTSTLVVGDATGHGLHAGMVVGAAKSLFQTCSRENDLSQVMRRIETGLSAMHRREASMAMLLMRLQANHLRVTSAGMPPVLVWRRKTGRVEEFMLPSVPLGTLSRSEFKEVEFDLRQGDSVLVMTDGLAEVPNPQGDLLGYDRASDLFAQVAHLDPQPAIARLLELAAEYHEGTPLQDDMTLVFLKARI
jgi:serine phosphatase RsbU (regulator of sigma subunit)